MKARNGIGQFVSFKARLLALGLLLTTTGISGLATLNQNEPVKLISPLVETVKAKDPCENKDCITDPLYWEIKNDPIKKYIYIQFAQINTKVAREALEVAKQESGFNPKARNSSSTAKGIFQILDGTWRGYKCTGDVLNTYDNVRCAVKIYKSNNSWKQWMAKPVYL